MSDLEQNQISQEEESNKIEQIQNSDDQDILPQSGALESDPLLNKNTSQQEQESKSNNSIEEDEESESESSEEKKQDNNMIQPQDLLQQNSEINNSNNNIQIKKEFEENMNGLGLISNNNNNFYLQQQGFNEQIGENSSSSQSEGSLKRYFCKVCRAMVEEKCEIHGSDNLIAYSQLKSDFRKYKLYSEQYDPLFNIQKGISKIQEAIKHIHIPAMQEDYQLKRKVFKENSKLEDFLDKITYRNNKLLIDDLHLLPNLDELKRESYLIDMISKNYNIIKNFLNKYNQYRYENLSREYLNRRQNTQQQQQYQINGKRKHQQFQQQQQQQQQQYLMQQQQIGSEEEISPQKKQKIDDQQSQGVGSSNNINNQTQKQSQSQVKQPNFEVGLENMTQKEREVLTTMYNTTYEKHHHFSDVEKKMFAKFALLRKIKNQVTVSVTTDQWRLNRITVQIWLDKYKKFVNQKNEA